MNDLKDEVIDMKGGVEGVKKEIVGVNQRLDKLETSQERMVELLGMIAENTKRE